jgi:CHAT domain-containing protein/tetratricopeptide (TPR) repeat protein
MKKLCLLMLLLLFCKSQYAQGIAALQADLDTALAHNDFKKAEAVCAAAEKKLPRAQDSIAADFLLTAGSVFYHQKKFTQAHQYFLRAAERAAISPGKENYRYNLALFNQAACLHNTGRYAEAEPLYLASLPGLASAFGAGSVEYTRCFYTLGSMYIDMGRYAEAESMCAAAVNFYKTALGESSDDYLAALGSMGIIYQGQGRYQEAENIFVALLNYFSSFEQVDSSTIRTMRNNLGELYRHKGNYSAAAAELRLAISSQKNTLADATAFNNLGLALKASGNYPEAEVSYKKSLRIYKDAEMTMHPDYTNPLNNLGELYRVLGRLQDAVDCFEQVIAIRHQTLGTEHQNYANALNNLALVEFAVGQLDDAEQHFLECSRIYLKLLGERHALYANSLNNLASLYKEKNQLEKAEEMYKRCLDISLQVSGPKSDKYANYLGGLGGTYRRMGRYDEAIVTTTNALDILRSSLGSDHYDVVLTEYNLAETFRESGRAKEARDPYLRSVKGFITLIQNYFPYLSESDKTAFYYTISDAFETFGSFVAGTADGTDRDTLLSSLMNEQLAVKSMLLKESVRMNRVISQADPASRYEFNRLRLLKETIVQKYRLSPEDLAYEGTDLKALENEAREIEQRFGAVLQKSEPLKHWQQVAGKLQPGEAAVEMIRLQDYSGGRWSDSSFYCAVIMKHGQPKPVMTILPNGNFLEGTALSDYKSQIRARKDDHLSYDRYWKPLEKYIDGVEKIYFSGSGAYAQISLYSLYNPTNAKYLIDEREIFLVTGLSDLLEQRSGGGNKSAEIFAYPDYDLQLNTSAMIASSRSGFTSLPPLPGTQAEAASINGVLKEHGWVVSVHEKKDASEENLKKVNSPRILHVATHGFFLEDISKSETYNGMSAGHLRKNPLLRSGLMLAGAAAIARDSIVYTDREDGILTAAEASLLDLRGTEVVVLSACETGLGEQRNSQGVYGLQHAFMAAGASSVIMSLWVVDDNATKELMTEFYRNWINHPEKGKHAAFRKAQLTLREKYPAAYFWSAFVITGL